MINADIVALASGKKAKKPKPYPRPGQKKSSDTKRIGGGDSALPVQEMHAWIHAKLEQIQKRKK